MTKIVERLVEKLQKAKEETRSSTEKGFELHRTVALNPGGGRRILSPGRSGGRFGGLCPTKTEKWSPDDLKPKWDLALSLL